MITQAIYNLSYYFLYGWYSVRDWLWRHEREVDESSDSDFEDEIEISHIYFRPTSANGGMSGDNS